jgi:hypothetical protein
VSVRASAAAIALIAAAASGASAPSGAPSWEVSLAPPGEPGVPFVIEGRVLGAGDRPLRDVVVYAYHADAAGDYFRRGEKKPKLSGMLRTNVLGQFRIRTVLPGLAEGIPHIHFELAAPGADYRAVTVSLARKVGAGSDTSFSHLPQMLSLDRSSGHWAYARPDTARGYRCDWDIPFGALRRLDTAPEVFKPAAP